MVEHEFEKVVKWLHRRVVTSARGDLIQSIEGQPNARFWLGRLAPEDITSGSVLGDRAERMEPCAIGIEIILDGDGPWKISVQASGCGWFPVGDRRWQKTPNATGMTEVVIQSPKPHELDAISLRELNDALNNSVGRDLFDIQVHARIEASKCGDPLASILLVNASAATDGWDSSLYQAEMTLSDVATKPFLLESLRDSFRYDRRVVAFGINCGIEAQPNGALRTTDEIAVDRKRPIYWASTRPQPDLRFSTLATDPLPQLQSLVEAHEAWGSDNWSDSTLDKRAIIEGWTEGMRAEAAEAAAEFRQEAQRLHAGCELLAENGDLLRAYRLMNAAMAHASRGRYEGWRPFQVGFQLANLPSVLNSDDSPHYVDILWFATGGGKTETYLGLLVLAAFFDRLRGKSSGVTAWSRFPLRLLSLQQTQRFADALGGAELVRRRERIGGAPFSLGFFVGGGNTPNRISLEPNEFDSADPDDPSMPARFRIIDRCPFCHSASVAMEFDRESWRLSHTCTNADCPWPDHSLPIYVVDEEIYRFLPTIIVGTLDKVALVSMQAAMRGFFAAPSGRCGAGHGYTYASRSTRRNGCLAPGCTAAVDPLSMPAELFAPSFRLQDELHLLRDSLGAIDAHYEVLLDHLQEELSSTKPRVVASSATLSGYRHQCEVLYDRPGRVFPCPGPTAESSFWTASGDQLLRRLVALAPRGSTLEFAADQLITELQGAIRELISEPERTCKEIDIPPSMAQEAISLFGTNVIYGNTIRDLDAATRSLETQIPIRPLGTAQLTGHTPFADVRATLARLENPEVAFNDRVHVVTASSMMSHGVDVDRLNTMAILGVPLTTAEFIQTTARIGRRYPGLVFQLHKMALERDAKVFQSFYHFVAHGDRFVEAIPITSKSRRVLDRTMAGIAMARLLHVHEPASGKALTTVRSLREFMETRPSWRDEEIEHVIHMLGLLSPMDEPMRSQVRSWFDDFIANVDDQSNSSVFPSDRSPSGPPMRSLRDVEEQAPISD